MLLSRKTTIQLNSSSANIVGHMCYAAYKLWNVCNYERNNYKELGLTKYPAWYYQKSAHKDDIWFKSLPSQTAQEVCKLLDKSWKSFYALVKSKGVENPKPPRYKKDCIPITYMQNGFVHATGSDMVRLSLSKKLKEYMFEAYGISDNYLFLKNKIFQNTDTIKQIKLYPPKTNGVIEAIVIYEVTDTAMLRDNGKYLSIDLGLHNLMTCYDNSGKTFILGRDYLNLCNRYDKEIARVQSQWAKVQANKGIKYPKPSKHLCKLYTKRKNCIKDYLHKMSHYIVAYCKRESINTVVIGDITGIRDENNLGSRINRQLHSLPYAELCIMLEYKLKINGIRFVKQEESYSSQCSPMSYEVSALCAQKNNRKQRGLYIHDGNVYNADAVGAYNILRKYISKLGNNTALTTLGLSNSAIIKVAV